MLASSNGWNSFLALSVSAIPTPGCFFGVRGERCICDALPSPPHPFFAFRSPPGTQIHLSD